MNARIFTAVFGIIVVSATASAQRADSAVARTDTADARLACATSGFTARAWSGDENTSAIPRPAPVAPARRTVALDTTIVLSITNSIWQRDNVNAGVALGGGGTIGSRGPWSACAGASVHLSRATAQLRNVAGHVHFRADMSALDSIGRTRSTTPPAVPPRR